ncbi:MAG: ABC transporter permease [Pseudomonadota bacterium]
MVIVILKTLLRNRTSWVLMSLQVAVTLAVLINALALVKRSQEIVNEPTGMDTGSIVTIRVVPFAQEFNDTSRIRTQRTLDLATLRGYPGVINASVSNSFPGDLGSNSGISPAAGDENAGISAGVFVADEHLLDTLGVELVAGRNFTATEVFDSNWPPADKSLPQLIIITEATAREIFPDGNALGQLVRIDGTTRTIIGITGTFRGRNPLLGNPNLNVFIPGYLTNARQVSSFLVRVEPGTAQALMNDIEEELLELNDGRDIEKITLASEGIAVSNGLFAYGGLVLMVISGLLVFTTALGIFGVAYFSVTRRTRQIGVRRALGATRGEIMQYFFLENLLTTGSGVILGSLLAIALNMVMTQLGLGRADLLVTGAGVFFVLLMGQAAVLLPAYRASQIEPAIATRA